MSEHARDLYILALRDWAKAALEETDLVKNPLIPDWQRTQTEELIAHYRQNAARTEAQANTFATDEEKMAYQKELAERNLVNTQKGNILNRP